MRAKDQKELAKKILDRIGVKKRAATLSRASGMTDSFVSIQDNSVEATTPSD